jgi:hypothetical protein
MERGLRGEESPANDTGAFADRGAPEVEIEERVLWP